MKIKPMLVRLQSTLGRNDLIEKMVLLPEPSVPTFADDPERSVNLVVAYNSSPKSQTALDMTLWIAHQTRLATQKEVTVQVVYVLDEDRTNTYPSEASLSAEKSLSARVLELSEGLVLSSATSAGTQATANALAENSQRKILDDRYIAETAQKPSLFEQADRILWQARCLAEEWRGSFKAHLRFGDVTTELRTVVESEAAALLFLGCSSVEHPIVKKLGRNFPCPVLGIPNDIETEGRI